MSISTDPEKYKENPVKTVLAEYSNLSEVDENNLSKLSVDKYERVWTEFKEFMDSEYPEVHLLEADQNNLNDYRDFLLEDKEFAHYTVEHRLGVIGVLYSKLVEEEAVQANPAHYVLRHSNFDDGDEQPEIPLQEMQEFVRDLDHPQRLAMVLTLLKFGPRVGAVANIDLQCINLDHSGYRRMLDMYDITLHEKVADNSDTLYIYPDIDIGDVVNGDLRLNQSNKRKRGAVVPIDDELKEAYLRWLAVRPETPELPAQPLFLSRHHMRRYRNGLGGTICNIVEDIRPEWRDMPDGKANVSAHYFRHYFDTNHQRGHDKYHDRSLSEAEIQYLRGDSPDSNKSLNDYTHDWSVEWGPENRESYLENVYKFF